MFSTRTEDINCQITLINKVNSLAVSLLDEWVKWLSKSIHNEPNLPKLLVVQQVAAIKDEGRLHHCLIYPLKVIGLELIPLSEHCQSMRIIACLIRVCCHRDSICFLVLLAAWVIPLKLGCGQICEDLLPCDLHVNMTVKQAAESHLHGYYLQQLHQQVQSIGCLQLKHSTAVASATMDQWYRSAAHQKKCHTHASLTHAWALRLLIVE